ncbi:PTS transporter subunit EIIC [Bombilactobacillus apium]|uniref:PTS transporter subunit EIIC n=1 Tax=Bombilactobacillus apium TaxID=2675299 RepID=UPI002B4B88E0|nr:PTS transporter subunit EIIC [Bombilactobacillus apium]
MGLHLTLLLFIACFIYSMGISGWVLAPITQPLMLAGIAAAATEFAANKPISLLYMSEVIYNFAWIGGVGCTLPLVLMMLFFAKSQRLKALGKACIVPSLFNINEPVVFGTIVWNPYLMIPLWINGIVIPLITWFGFRLVLAAIPHALMQMWYIPFPFLTWVMSPSLRAMLLIVIIFVVTWLIWYPFFRVYDQQTTREELPMLLKIRKINFE